MQHRQPYLRRPPSLYRLLAHPNESHRGILNMLCRIKMGYVMIQLIGAYLS
jgi:hypothetical protein